MNNFRRRTGKKLRKVVSLYVNYPLRIVVTSVDVQDGGPYKFPVVDGSTISNFNIRVAFTAYIGTRTEYSDGSVELTETALQFLGVNLNTWRVDGDVSYGWVVACEAYPVAIGSISALVNFSVMSAFVNNAFDYNPTSLGNSTYWLMGIRIINSYSGELLYFDDDFSSPNAITATATSVQNGISVKIQL